MAKCDAADSLILKIAVPVPLDRLFDYRPSELGNSAEFQRGARVLVPFGKRQCVGVVMGSANGSTLASRSIKPVIELLDNTPLLSALDLQLLEWAARYYHHPIGEVVATAFPTALRQGLPATLQCERYFAPTAAGRAPDVDLGRATRQKDLLRRMLSREPAWSAAELAGHKPALRALIDKGLVEPRMPDPSDGPVVLGAALAANPDQQAAIDAVGADLGRFAVHLLEGVTGSGKTEVYMQIIARTLALGLQVLVLLPEINLTPQLEQRFRQRFGVGIETFHSNLTDRQRQQAWLSMRAGVARILLGTRSALFTPLREPGLIVLDEEHDGSFKQQDGFRFSARDVAIARAKLLNIPVVMGSATPSLESLANVAQGRYRLSHLPHRAGNAKPPAFQVLDIRGKKLQAGLSEPLVTAIGAELAEGRQVLLFLNRRGYAPVQICHDCGWVSRCHRCDANLVIHAGIHKLRCHHCGYEQALPRQCPACGVGELQALGLGTERIEETLKELFAGHRIVRLDRDTTQCKGALEGYLQQIHRGDADIVLGTQMLAKGHHFPNVTLVAILDIDSGLFSIDFRGGEKLAQLIVQVAGRAGRAELPGRVILQTRHPRHALLHNLLSHGYRAFAETALSERRAAGLPPFGYQALLRAQAGNAGAPQQFLGAAIQCLTDFTQSGVQVLGPVSAPMVRRAGLYRYQILLQSDKRPALQRLLDFWVPRLADLREARSVRWSLDVDPLDLY
ncbi:MULTISPECIES: primosomal protein N' [Methylomonas]|uniref:Replication restart protein PriA n=1 Tax=Methylomonas koyamae TaxID=702114 RepID=A0A177NVR5_9GAMM|nr:primosomal protein N' [Methylomonas koyamae]OAI21373.1 primosomal protein N' [Methylomonas koyamae]